MYSVRAEFIKRRISRATTPSASDSAQPRCMLVFAHPDDEVIAVGARLSAFRNAHFIYITDGAPRDQRDSQKKGFRLLRDYREARFQELSRTFELSGISTAKRGCLEYPDQEAAYNLSELIETIAKLIEIHGIQIVFTHPYEGGQPDHDAAAFAVHTAAQLLQSRAPLIVEAPFYHHGQHGIETGVFLNSSDGEEVVYTLSAMERARKQALLDCFTTQKETLRYFTTEMERYRAAPQYVFTKPPHAGRVFYDYLNWGITSDRFCHLAMEAAKKLTPARSAQCLQC
jgi:LmbE family N-acetylglucosaminyl deacetylase